MKKTGTGTLAILAIGAYVAYKKWWAPAAAPEVARDAVSPLLQPMAQTDQTIKAATQFAEKAVDDMTGKSDWGAWT